MLKNAGRWLWQKKWWLLAIGVGLLIGRSVYLSRQADQPEYTYVPVESRTITETLDVSGAVDAKEKAQLHFPASSRLTWLGVHEGEMVKKWQSIASVDTRTLQKQMEINQNMHGKQFRAFEGTLETYDYYDDSGLTEAERRVVESAQLDLRNSALNVEISDLAIKLSNVYSPIEGIVTRIDQKNVGALVLPTDVFEIVNPKTLHFTVVVDEQDIGLVKEQQLAEVVLDAFDDETIQAVVSSIAFVPSTGQTGGTGYEVELALDNVNEQRVYRLGMNGEVKIVLNRKEDVISIPLDSLFERDGKTYTRILEGGTVTEREVETGLEDEEWVEVITGVTVNETIAVPKNGLD